MGTKDHLTFLAGGGEMGARMRERDWSDTPVGDPEHWPQSLRSTVSMLLPSKAQIILFWGPQFTVLYNDAYRPVFGGKHPHALGLPGSQAWREIWDTQLHALLDRVVRTGEAFWARDLLFQIERYRFVEDTYFDVSYDPVRDESGNVGGVFCIVTETTERVVGARRMELLRDLAARNAKARTAREACALAIETLESRSEDLAFALCYLDNVLQGATPDAEHGLAGCPPELVKTLSVGSSGPGGRPARLVVGINPRRPFDHEYRSFLDLVGDQVATALANARAYEDERQRAEALAELDRAKTVFFSNVSHEFRTPLTLMLGPLEHLLAEADGPLTPAQKNDGVILQRNARRLLKLVNALLEFSRIEAGRAQPRYAPTDLCAATRELASAFHSAIEDAGIRFEVDCDTIDAPVFVDRDMWDKIVLNLLSNALKFTFEGTIRVELHARGDAAELTVSDTGTGIPASELPRIFERFHRVEGAPSRTHEGTGIGLALTQDLVRLHGGTITAETEFGKGSRFIVRIPSGRAHLPPDRVVPAADVVARETAALFVDEAERWLPTAAPMDRDAAPQTSPRDRILIADDNADMRDYVRQVLRDWDVVTAVDGVEALERAQTHLPSLILADVMMPRLDGFGLLRELRSDPRTRAIPVLILSARAGEGDRVSGLDAGADDYVVKPFRGPELVARVRSLINLSRARRDAEAANRTKDQFLAMLGHELRNPLAPILTALQLMSLRGDASSVRERAVIDRQVRHLVRLIDDLLDVSRIARGKIELRHQTVELSEVVAAAVESTSPALEERFHRLKVDVPQGLLLSGDATRLTQIVVNVLSNAAKYTEANGDIRIEARRDGASVELRVQDSGIGISSEMLPRVFDMFAQERQALDRSHGGLGLGLTIARSLVELHEGTIEVRSDGVGRGSEFVIRLPLLTTAAGATPAGSPAATSGTRVPTGRRVLVVDDNIDAARMMSDALELVGHETRVAFDGPSALRAAAEFRPDAALLDLGLPVMDGYELAQRLGNLSGTERPILIAVTGYGQVSDQQKSLAAGFQAHIVKPVDVPRLITQLDRLLAASPSAAVRDGDGLAETAPEAQT
jgi:signal transduction histidine kinase